VLSATNTLRRQEKNLSQVTNTDSFTGMVKNIKKKREIPVQTEIPPGVEIGFSPPAIFLYHILFGEIKKLY
jgi:hypothetical protein